MDLVTITSMLDELEKIAISGQVPRAPKAPKTSAPPPPPAARMAPTKMPNPPSFAPPALPHSGVPGQRHSALATQNTLGKRLPPIDPRAAATMVRYKAPVY